MVRMVCRSLNQPAPLPQIPVYQIEKHTAAPEGHWVGNTGKFHEQSEIFSGAGTMDVLNMSTVHLHSGQPPMVRKGDFLLVADMVQVLLERKRSCTMLVTWKASQRWKREINTLLQGLLWSKTAPANTAPPCSNRLVDSARALRVSERPIVTYHCSIPSLPSLSATYVSLGCGFFHTFLFVVFISFPVLPSLQQYGFIPLAHHLLQSILHSNPS